MKLRLAASTAALLALAQPALAQSAQCVEPADLADATTYAMPLLVEGLQTNCAGSLPADSFVLGRGDAFAARFDALQDQAWPGARRFLLTFMEAETGKARSASDSGDSTTDVVKLIGQLDGDELRPFVDGILLQLVAQEIKPSTCADVERVLPLLAPLPPENYGPLLSTIIGLVADEQDSMQLCSTP